MTIAHKILRAVVGILWLCLLIGFFSGCKSTKTTASTSSKVKMKEESEVKTFTKLTDTISNKVTEHTVTHAGDALTGFVPLTAPVGEDTLTIPVESAGVRLDLKVTKQGIAYTIKTKPTTTTTITAERSNASAQVSEEKSIVNKEIKGSSEERFTESTKISNQIKIFIVLLASAAILATLMYLPRGLIPNLISFLLSGFKRLFKK